MNLVRVVVTVGDREVGRWRLRAGIDDSGRFATRLTNPLMITEALASPRVFQERFK